MSGALSRAFGEWREELTACLAHCEAVIDFAEDEKETVRETEIMRDGACSPLIAAASSWCWLLTADCWLVGGGLWWRAVC
jgi:hypothetical protein